MSYVDVELSLRGKASQCTTCTVVGKDVLIEAADTIKVLRERVEALEVAIEDTAGQPHGDLIDRDDLRDELILDESIEVVARTKIINEYVGKKLEKMPVIVPSNRKQKTIQDGRKELVK